LDRFLWSVPAVTGTRALVVATITAVGVTTFGGRVFSYSPAYLIRFFPAHVVGESLAIVGSLLSLVGALVALGVPQRRRKVAT
jgi:xanthine/uracil permease